MNAIPYDFTKPARLSTDWINRLTGWYRVALTQMNKTWAKQLPVPLEASLRDLDGCFAHTLGQLPDGMTGYRVTLAGGQVPTMLVLPQPLLLHLIAVLLNDRANGATERELTLVDENLADYFFAHWWLPFFRTSWPARELVSWELQPRESEVQTSRYFATADVLLALSLQIVGPWGTGDVTWYFQQERLLTALSDPAARRAPMPEAVLAARCAAAVNNLPMQVELVLGTAELKLSQLSRLQVGDVILLDRRDDDAIVGRTGERALFHAQAGRIGSMKAIRIASEIGR